MDLMPHALLEEVSFVALFALTGLRQGSRSWSDYERGKYLLRGLPPDEYERGVLELTEYLCL